MAVQRSTFLENEVAVWAFAAGQALLEECTFDDNVDDTATYTLDDEDPPGTIYTDAIGLEMYESTCCEDGEMLPLDEAPRGIFMQADDPDFTALRTVSPPVLSADAMPGMLLVLHLARVLPVSSPAVVRHTSCKCLLAQQL